MSIRLGVYLLTPRINIICVPVFHTVNGATRLTGMEFITYCPPDVTTRAKLWDGFSYPKPQQHLAIVLVESGLDREPIQHWPIFLHCRIKRCCQSCGWDSIYQTSSGKQSQMSMHFVLSWSNLGTDTDGSPITINHDTRKRSA